MKKILFLLTILLPFSAQAELEDKSMAIQPLTMSNRFLKRLTKCIPFEEQKSDVLSDVSINATYRIYGYTKKKECEFEFVSETNSGYTVSQICYLPQDIMTQYLQVIGGLLQKTSYTFESAAEMASDGDYREAVDIMKNKKYCDFYRDQIDFTKQIRDSLLECQPTWDNQSTNNVEITRKIVGKNGTNCQFEEVISFKRSDLNKLTIVLPDELREKIDYEEDQSFLYTCQLDEEDLGELRDIYNSMVIPASKSLDDINAEMPNEVKSSEANFLSDRCTLEKL